MTEQLWTANRNGEVKIRKAESGPASKPAKTVMDTFYDIVKKYGDKPALHQKIVPFGKSANDVEWTTWSWNKYKSEVDSFAKSLISIDFQPRDVVNIIGFNAPEWNISDFGTIAAGGISAGIYATNNADACKYISIHSKAKVIVLDGNKQLEKYAVIASELSDLKAIVFYGTETINEEFKSKISVPVYTFKEFQELGNDVSDEDLKARIEPQKPNQICTLIYTSGTTGNPKAVMITHDNIIWTCGQLLTQLPRKLTFDDSIISYLPLSHIAAQCNDLFCGILTGTQVWFAQADALRGSLVVTLKEVRPTIFFAVPRVWEKIYTKMQAVAKEITGLKKTISTWAKSQALAHHDHSQFHNKTTESCTASVFYPFAKKILHKVHVSLGLDRCIAAYVGAAPIETKILKYFASIDLPIWDVFGQSECTGPHAVNSADFWQIGTCGRALPGTETKIIEENGELCYRGRHIFAGYMGMEDMTKEAIDDEGWLHSGDTAKIDSDGFITITGRIKELIITAGGENVAPVLIEDQFKAAMPALSHCMVIGDKKKFLSILLCLQNEVDEEGAPSDKLIGEALETSKRIGSKATTSTEAATCEAWKKYFDEGMKQANTKAISNAQKIQKWTLIPKEFSEKGSELTPTLKLKRKVTAEKYHDIVEAMYA